MVVDLWKLECKRRIKKVECAVACVGRRYLSREITPPSSSLVYRYVKLSYALLILYTILCLPECTKLSKKLRILEAGCHLLKWHKEMHGD